MRDEDDRLAMLLASCVAVLVGFGACTIHYLPAQYAIPIVSWAMLSLSVTISFGHCVLNEP